MCGVREIGKTRAFAGKIPLLTKHEAVLLPETMMQYDRELDVKGLNCPLPILRTKKALAEMQSGQTLRVMATDPGSVKDFQAFARQTGNEMLSSGQVDGVYEYVLKRK